MALTKEEAEVNVANIYAPPMSTMPNDNRVQNFQAKSFLGKKQTSSAGNPNARSDQWDLQIEEDK